MEVENEDRSARSQRAPEAMEQPDSPCTKGNQATLVLRPAQSLQPNTRSCGSQPANISLDHASCNDTLTSPLGLHGHPLSSPHAVNYDVVLTGIKATPSGWPSASLDTGSGRRQQRQLRGNGDPRPAKNQDHFGAPT